MIIKFQGEVKIEIWPDRLLIGDRDVIHELVYDHGYPFDHPVTVAFADERFTGDLDAGIGVEGYGEWTPEIPAEFDVGGHNILELIERYKGQQLTLWIADEPINTLE